MRLSAPSATRMPMEFDDYELLEEIGRGGQGVVYRARQKSLNRTVALKVIGLGRWATESHLKRFRLEAEAAASLDHPSIVPIHEIGERDGCCYFSMNLVEGGQLDEGVRREPMSIRRAAELMAKLARAVHLRARAWHSASRHQAGKHFAGWRRRTASDRLRSGAVGRKRERYDPHDGHARHAELHGPGTSRVVATRS